MKTIHKYIAAAFAAIAAISCAKQEISEPNQDPAQGNTYQYVLNVSQEGTKTSLGEDGLSILWSKEDQIGIACSFEEKYKDAKASGGAQSIADAETYEPSTSATFNITLTEEGYKPLAAIYPYYDGSVATSGGSLTGQACSAYIPEIQTGIKDGIPANAFAMVGSIKDNMCQMHNVGSIIKFEITTEHVTSLKFEGNNSEIISGARYYYTNTGEFAKETSNSGKTSVTLVPSGVVFETGVYYFVVSPNTLTDGFTITLTTVKGQTVSKSTTSEFKIERNKKYTGFGSDKGWFSEIMTGAASNLGTADGTTATLYGIIHSDMVNVEKYGFQTSSDGENWTDYNGQITNRFFTEPTKPVNTFTATLSGLTPENTVYYRAVCTNTDGLTTYGKVNSFKTYSNAQSAVIDLYNGWEKENWPFTNIERNDKAQTENEGINKGTGSVALWKDVPLTLEIAGGLEFEAKANGGAWLNNANGSLTLKVKNGDYIKFPVIAGKKPVCVILVAGNIATDYLEPKYNTGSNNTMGLPSIQKVIEGGIEDVAGGARWNPNPNHIYNIHTWELNGTDSGQYEMHFNSSSALNSYISYIEVVYADASSKLAKIEQNLIFYDYTGNHNNEPALSNGQKLWPFNGATNSPHPKFVEAVEFQGPYYTTNNPEIQYLFKVQSYKTSDCWRVTGQGFRFGGTVGDYMSFQPVEGYKLTYIKIRGGNKKVLYSVTDASGKITAGGNQETINNSYDSTVEFNLTETSANTEYHLVLGSTEPSAIREMWITYELVK